ncbi:UNVERIFIED_CONTAM: hypothetical protein GTU68_053747 [Idotea baltica]|nr:hypothetical protein [Idotea baltica]
MAADIPKLEALIEDAKCAFKKTFSSDATICVCAPGRVNLIGEHTDYNAGFVLPMALSLTTIIVGNHSAQKNKCQIKSLAVSSDDCDFIEFFVPSEANPLTASTPTWANYVKGVVANFHTKISAFNAVIISSVPIGGGVSSSAALEVATYTFLEGLTGSKAISLQAKATACQKAEHDFANVPCGIMDQFISTMGVKGSALLIDCRSLDSSLVALSDPSVTFVICNSNVKHSLSGSEYPTRRNQCHSAAKIMKKESLREASLQDLEDFKGQMDEETQRRVRHVITEIQRTLEAATALKESNHVIFGRLMNESHKSLKNDYEVSCPELDELVDIATSVPGVFGSRMTGGGFGGCTVTLVKQDSVSSLIAAVHEKYSGKATIYVSPPSDGARVLSL